MKRESIIPLKLFQIINEIRSFKTIKKKPYQTSISQIITGKSVH
jgi:hypothetical protein